MGRTGFGLFRVGRTGFGWFRLVSLFSNYPFTDVVGEKRIDLAYPIRNLDLSSKDVAVVSMFGDNVQYQIKNL